MQSKKGFELAVNTLVVIILSLVLLGVGFWLFFTLSEQTMKIDQDVSDQLKSQIEQEMENSGSRVVIPTVAKTIERGKTDYYTIGIQNVLSNGETFSVITQLPSMTDLLGNIVSCGSANCPNIITTGLEGFTILQNEKEYRKIWVKVPKNAEKGQYIIDVNVCSGTTGNEPPCTTSVKYPPPFKIYVLVP
ncbi:MAG: hypothetical protein V1743_02105 [Nanoarchaeota archaeon]